MVEKLNDKDVIEYFLNFFPEKSITKLESELDIQMAKEKIIAFLDEKRDQLVVLLARDDVSLNKLAKNSWETKLSMYKQMRFDQEFGPNLIDTARLFYDFIKSNKPKNEKNSITSSLEYSKSNFSKNAINNVSDSKSNNTTIR